MATQYDPIAKDESLNTTETPSRNVADVLAEELQNIASAIGGGGGSGGHTIEGADGTALSQEPTLQFADADATDDAVNEKTVVNVVRKRTQAQYDAMSAADQAKGIIHITDANAKPLSASQVRYGDGSVKDALDDGVDIIKRAYSGKELVYSALPISSTELHLDIPACLGNPSSVTVTSIIEMGVGTKTYDHWSSDANGTSVWITNSTVTLGRYSAVKATLTWS